MRAGDAGTGASYCHQLAGARLRQTGLIAEQLQHAGQTHSPARLGLDETDLVRSLHSLCSYGGVSSLPYPTTAQQFAMAMQ